LKYENNDFYLNSLYIISVYGNKEAVTISFSSSQTISLTLPFPVMEMKVCKTPNIDKLAKKVFALPKPIAKVLIADLPGHLLCLDIIHTPPVF